MMALQNGYAGAALPQSPDMYAPVLGSKVSAEQSPTKSENEDVVVQLRSRSQSATASEDEQRAKIISRLTEENPATVAEIIQIWLSEGKKS
jgi:flagellar biosynthesis/type III secretory pathway M-ring protein FliF/YscJ